VEEVKCLELLLTRSILATPFRTDTETKTTSGFAPKGGLIALLAWSVVCAYSDVAKLTSLFTNNQPINN
jgi:hypothetical protein